MDIAKAAEKQENNPESVIKKPDVKGNRCDCMERYADILNLLETSKDKLIEILKHENQNASCIPKYILPGINIIKSVNMVNTLDRLIKEFCEGNNISQKDIFQVALIDFLNRYGYRSEVKAVLNV